MEIKELDASSQVLVHLYYIQSSGFVFVHEELICIYRFKGYLFSIFNRTIMKCTPDHFKNSDDIQVNCPSYLYQIEPPNISHTRTFDCLIPSGLCFVQEL